MADDPKYITRLMRIRCTKGTLDNYINVDMDHGVLAGAEQQPVLNANDHTKKNIIHCGNCESDENPERMFRKGVVGGVVSGLMGPLGFLLAGSVTDLLEDVGIMTCKCKPNTPKPWLFTNEDNILEGAPALTMNSKLACRYGGTISFVPLDEYPPEEPAQMSEEAREEAKEKAEDAPPAEDVVGAAWASALEDAKAQIEATGEAGKEAVENARRTLAAAAAMPAHSCELDKGIPQDFGEVPLRDMIYITEEERNRNYAHNMAQKLPDELLDGDKRMIIDQGSMENYVINRYSVKYGGCGAIALYNTIKTLDPESEVTFPQVVYWMEPYGVLNNTLGAAPLGITSALNDMGYETQVCFFKEADEISELAAEADAAVALYIRESLTAHYVAFHAAGTNESGQQVFKFYNEIYKAKNDVRTYLSFEQNHGIADLEEAKREYSSEEAPGEPELTSIVILVNKPE